MKSLWNDDEASAAVSRYAGQAVNEDLALRTYSARLLGGDPALVLHGGGNTSVKTTLIDLFGEETPVLCVKGSGWDLASIEPAGHPAVRLAPLRRLRRLERLSDEAMVDFQRQNLLDARAPNPSVETLLHAFIAARFIDHTHSTAILALADQADAERIVEAVFGERVACVPYVMPGFALAKAAAEIWEARPKVEGLILLRHGVFSFGDTARQSYERMISLVTAAEAHIADRRAKRRPAPRHPPDGGLAKRGKLLPSVPDASRILPVLRGVLAAAAKDRWPERWIFDLRSSDEVLALANHPRLADLARRGVATPDHVIRTKRAPLVVPAPQADPGRWREAAVEALAAFVAEYEAYFRINAARAGEPRTPIDPLPRVLAIPGLGLAGLGRNAKDAGVAADIACAWASTLLAAEAVGRFTPVGEADTFDIEYWSLEQAKLGKAIARRLEGCVVVITGGAGTIGSATAEAFAAEGAQIAVLDLDPAPGADRWRLAQRCDVTDAASVRAAFEAVCARFGGVDIVVSNAGAAATGMMAEMSAETLRRSFDLNFFAHQTIAKAAVAVFRAQAAGGTLLFNISKQAVNPGPDFGAYGTAKAALLALMRQYALEHGADGVRVNAVNPDRIRSGLLTPAMIAERAAARGLDEATYMSGNLLGEEVTAKDVAQAFVFASLMKRTTGAVIPVDGGAVAAMMR
ncbi:MAG: bifunctional aldolase/short-chain dehydrogenase [Caulobacteraceae bacterium]